MKLAHKRRRKLLIPINSMSDIAFLLLIFIMLLSLINYKKEVKIEYPEAEYQEKTQQDSNFEIWVTEPGEVFYKGNPVRLTDLENLIVDQVLKNPETRFHIIADKNVEYRYVNRVIEVLKLLQVRAVSMVVKEN